MKLYYIPLFLVAYYIALAGGYHMGKKAGYREGNSDGICMTIQVMAEKNYLELPKLPDKVKFSCANYWAKSGEAAK